jgi:hypothetical protein
VDAHSAELHRNVAALRKELLANPDVPQETLRSLLFNTLDAIEIMSLSVVELTETLKTILKNRAPTGG